ncbi:MAG: histidine phosphatase family protein [Deltaproteobacteria bacterium]|nr:histidine phosphatase family protein [Deltaproteobacteria bacterium]
MTILLLIRHGATDALGTYLAGRQPGLHLNAEGQQQALRLAERLAHLDISAVLSSPLERALETAAPIAARHLKEILVCEELNEIDFGDWTGRPFSELSQLPLWQAFNVFRSSTRIPGGELMVSVQQRAVGCLQAFSNNAAGGILALVSHADVIKAALCHYAGMPLDLLLRLRIDPGSVSGISVADRGAEILFLNLTDSLGL